ncbi:prominin-2 [Struthio camelus]|uniref:prominin-2 n=1 Tax=Struthio camelus TaxID=8801 RepID=UPI003603C453
MAAATERRRHSGNRSGRAGNSLRRPAGSAKRLLEPRRELTEPGKLSSRLPGEGGITGPDGSGDAAAPASAKPRRPGEPAGASRGSAWALRGGAARQAGLPREKRAEGACSESIAATTARAMRAAERRAALPAALLLAWALLGPGSTQQCPPADPGGMLRFTDTHADIRVPALHRVPSALDPLYGLVRRCLDLVQQNPLPTELLRAALNNPALVKTSQVVQYELGYVVCAAVALLFALAVPAGGVCFCYHRRRRRCGGRLRVHWRSLGCCRHCLLACLSATSVVSLAAVICALVANQRVTEQMEPGLVAVPATLRALQQHISNIPQGVQMVVEQFEVPRERIIADLGDLSRSVGISIHSQLKAATYTVLADLRDRAEELRASLHHLQTVERTARALAAARARLEPALQERRQHLVALLDDPRCAACASALGRAQSLEPGADYGQVPSVERVLQALSDLPGSDFPESIRQANATFNAIPELAVERMAPLVQELRLELAKATEKVRAIAAGFPPPDYARLASQALRAAEDGSRPYLQEARRLERYRWTAGMALCAAVLLVLGCNAAGMALGAYGLRRRQHPGEPECRSEAGARFLMVGVGLSFLFSAFLSLLVLASFLVGGNVQTLVCRNWGNREIYEFIDTPGNLPPSMNLSRQLNLRRGYNLSAAYHECKSGAGLWEVLQLDEPYDLGEHLEASKYAAAFQKRLADFSARLGDVRLLGADGRRDLRTFARSGVDRLDYGRFRAEMRNPVVKTSLAGLASSLEGLQKMQRNGTVAARLAAEALALWRVHNSTVREQEASVAKLNESVRFLSALAPHLQARLNETLAATASLEAALPARAQRLLRQELGCFARKELRYFSQYLHWVGQTLREEVASCQPLATALDNGRVILCDRIAEPWNAFWFSLACCTFCLVPAIVLAVQLAEHFRPGRRRLISTGSDETCPFHIPRVTALKL